MSFLSYFLTLTPSVSGLAELPATLISKLGCHVGMGLNYIYIYIYIYSLLGCRMAPSNANSLRHHWPGGRHPKQCSIFGRNAQLWG